MLLPFRPDKAMLVTGQKAQVVFHVLA